MPRNGPQIQASRHTLSQPAGNTNREALLPQISRWPQSSPPGIDRTKTTPGPPSIKLGPQHKPPAAACSPTRGAANFPLHDVSLFPRSRFLPRVVSHGWPPLLRQPVWSRPVRSTLDRRLQPGRPEQSIWFREGLNRASPDGTTVNGVLRRVSIVTRKNPKCCPVPCRVRPCMYFIESQKEDFRSIVPRRVSVPPAFHTQSVAQHLRSPTKYCMFPTHSWLHRIWS